MPTVMIALTILALPAARADEIDIYAFTPEAADYVSRFVETALHDRFIEPARAIEVFKSPWQQDLLLALDPARMYFLREDADGFSGIRYANGIHFSFARVVHDRLKQRIHEAAVRAEHWLNQPHDFTIDEEMLREYDALAVTKGELDERWRKRIKLELLTEKMNGDQPSTVAPKLVRRYHTIRDRVCNMNDEELYSRFVNVLLQKIDLHAAYLSPDLLMDFNTGFVYRFTLGFYTRRVKGEWVIDRVSPSANVNAKLAVNVVGMQIVAIRSGETEMVFTGNSDHKALRYISDYEPLGKADHVTLELRDPKTWRRLNVEWPRYVVRH